MKLWKALLLSVLFVSITATVVSAVFPGVPRNTIMFYATTTCPANWTVVTETQGRAITGVPSAGTLAGTVGTALTNLGNHITPAGTNSAPVFTGSSTESGSGSQTISSATTGITITAGNASQTISVNSGTGAAMAPAASNNPSVTDNGHTHTLSHTVTLTPVGTNTAPSFTGTPTIGMPYIQLLACKKG